MGGHGGPYPGAGWVDLAADASFGDGIEPFFTFSGAVALSPDGRHVTFVQVAVTDGSFETAIPEATGMFVLDRATGQLERRWDIDWRGLSDNGFVPTQLSRDGRFGLGLTTRDLVPADTNGIDDLYLVDLEHDPAQPQPRFAVWDLSVAPATPQPGESVEVTVRVKNVGDAAGTYQAVLLVDDVREPGATSTVTIAPGESQAVTIPVSRHAGGDYRVRIGQATGEFRVPAGMLAGHVTDANDGAPIDLATVTATNGETVRSGTTLGGAYQLERLQVGTWTVRVTADGYLPEIQQVTITEDGQQVIHDAALPAAALGVDRAGVEVALPAGATGTVQLGLANAGGADLAWRASAWETTVQDPPSILVYTSAGTDTHVDQALRRLGLGYTAFREDGGCGFSPPWDGIDRFGEALAAAEWDLVIVDHSCGFARLTAAIATALEDHVRSGGRLIIHSVKLEDTAQAPLWEMLGFEFVASLPGRFSGYWWDSDHPLFTTPLPVPMYIDRGEDMLAPLDGAVALAGYTQTDRPDHAGLVLANQGRTLYQGFRPQQAGDLDGDGVPDGVQLWVNSIVQVGGLAARQPWLAATDAGSLSPGGGAEVTLSVDTRSLAVGSYTGSVVLATDAAREPVVAVPVTLTVTDPVAACDRTITDTHIGPLTVTTGVTCLTASARVLGEVTVRAGAGLVAAGATVVGPISATAATIVDLRESQVLGPVSVTHATERVSLVGNQLTGPVRVLHNLTDEEPIVLAGNRIIGPLSCLGNQPPPTNQGVPNTGFGPRTGECAGL